MADPTFKNVQFQPSSNTANAAFKAGDMINRAFQQIAGTVEDRAEGNLANVDAATEANTQKVIAEIQSRGNLESFDADAQQILDNLTSGTDVNQPGFDLKAINEAISGKRSELQTTRKSGQDFKLGELNLEGTKTDNDLNKLILSAKPAKIKVDQETSEANLKGKKASNQLADISLTEMRRQHKVEAQNREHISGFQSLQKTWIDAQANKNAGKPLTPEQSAVVDTSATDLVRDFVASSGADAATSEALVKYQKDMVGLNVQTPEQILAAQNKQAQQIQDDKIKMQKLKNEGNLAVAKLRRTGLGKGTSFTNDGTGLTKAINSVFDSLSDDQAEDWDAQRLRDYAIEVRSSWKDLGFQTQPTVNAIAQALELGVNLEYSDDLVSEDVIDKENFVSILQNIEEDDASANVDSLIEMLNAERLVQVQERQKASQQQEAAAQP